MTNDEVVEKGEIRKVKDETLCPNDFRVEIEYEGMKTDAIASREEIVEKNISALLDFYELKLNLKDKPNLAHLKHSS